MKRIIAWLCLVILLLTMAGCNAGEVASTETTAPKEEAVFESGDKIIFIGNSFIYYGKCVLDKGQKEWGLENRVNDQGYFYQICKANGLDISVTNFTFGGHKLSDFYSGKCAADRGHNGLNHLEYLTDRDYDYVVLQGVFGSDSTDILAECKPMMDLFREVNPNTTFVFLVPQRAYESGYPWLPNVKTLEEAGIVVVDWGKLVNDVITGATAVPGAAQTYNKNSFVISKAIDDGYHPNVLAGYITAQMTFCALTGKSAVGQKYIFDENNDYNSPFNLEMFKAKQYLFDVNTNFIEIFNSEADMRGLQQMIDRYLAEKAYRNYTE